MIGLFAIAITEENPKLAQVYPILKRWVADNSLSLKPEWDICQCCGMPMAATEHFGTNSDGNTNTDYCYFCYQNGEFTQYLPLDERIELSVGFMNGTEKLDGRTLTKEEAALQMRVLLPHLKRWQTHEIVHQEYYKAVNTAVDFINEHLHETINLYDLANAVHISGYHFHRIFKAILGESPGEYIRRLRLEKAAFKLHTSQSTLRDIAEQTGYQSYHALSKAFRKYYGVSPSEYRLKPSELNVVIQPAEKLNIEPDIREISPKTVISTRVKNPYIHPHAYTDAWKKLVDFMDVDGVPNKRYEYLCLMRDISVTTRPEHHRIYACITNVCNRKPCGIFVQQTIDGGLYAVFRSKGCYKNLESLYLHIYRDWIPRNPYELRDAASFEKFLNTPDMVNVNELLTEVYIPVVQLK
jgi:AraC family transcriptional regulator